MDARGKTIYACLTVLIFVAWFVASTLVMNFSKQVPGSSAMVFCVVAYLIERIFSKNKEQKVMLHSFLFVFTLLFVKQAMQMDLKPLLPTYGWMVVGMVIVCGISFIARKTKLINTEETPNKGDENAD